MSVAVAKTFGELVEKFNPYHDKRGRFTTSSGYASFTYSPGKSKAHDLAIQREKERTAGSGKKQLTVNQVETTAGVIDMPKLTGDRASEAEEARKKAIKDLDDYVLELTQRNHPAIKTTSDAWKEKLKEFATDNDDTNYWLKNHNTGEMYRDIIRYKTKAKKEQEKEEIKDRKSKYNAHQRAAGKRTQAYSRWIEFDSQMRDKYGYGHTSRMTDAEAKKYDELYSSIVFRNKRGQWQIAKSFSDILKFNPYHDRLGRFTSGGGFGVSSSHYTGNPDTKAVTFSANPKTRAGALAIERHGGVVPAAYDDDYVPPKKVEKPKTKKPKTEKPKDETDENGFKPAKTKDEAVEYAKKNLKMESADYGNLDIDTINHINKEITAIQKRYPELSNVQKIEMDKRQGVYAAAGTGMSGRNTFYIGSNHYGKGEEHLKDRYQKDVDSGYHPEGTDYKAIIWHEYGHMFAYTKCKTELGFAANETLGFFDGSDYVKGIKGRTYEKGVLRDAAKSLKITQKEFKSRISRYAEKNPAETFAEAFAEYHCSKNPRPECIAMMKAAGIAK